MFERIAVPLDGSNFGEMALPWAVEIAAAFGSELHVISVCETDVAEHRNMHKAYIEHKTEETLSQVRRHLYQGAFPPGVKSAILEGSPAAQILDYIEKADVGLLVLVSHGRSGIMPWTMGSTASRVLSQVTRPVLFVRARRLTAQPLSVIGHILVPLDGSSDGEAVLPYVRELASRTSSRTTLFRTLAAGYEVPTIGGLNYIPLPKAETDRQSNEARLYLDIIRTGFLGINVKTVACVGNAAAEINEFAGEHDVSLIAMSGPGSVTHKLLSSAKTPLLLVGTGPGTGRP